MKKVVFITPADVAVGFSLTGAGQYVADSGNVLSIVKSRTGEPETGLIIIDERLLTQQNEKELKEIEETWYGIVLVLPSPERPGADFDDYASRLIRQAIGYHVRLNV